VRTDIGPMRTVIAEKRRPPGGGLESREETPKEGICEPRPASHHFDAAAQQLQACVRVQDICDGWASELRALRYSSGVLSPRGVAGSEIFAID
jgi:hypothetical protein